MIHICVCVGNDKIPSTIENSKVKDHAVPDNKNEGESAIHSRHISLCLQAFFSFHKQQWIE